MGSEVLSVRQPSKLVLPATFLTLAISEVLLYRDSFGYFFQGDSIFMLYYRFRDFGDFLQAFLAADPANWYRPLSNRTIQSFFFSWFGLEPYGYHVVTFCLFFLNSVLCFFFVRQLTGSQLSAGIAAFYLGTHTVNSYTTFDFAYAPELLYFSFYVLSFMSFVRYLRSGFTIWYVSSVVFLVLSLLSKEAAVSLPLNLLAFIVLISPYPSDGAPDPNLGAFARALRTSLDGLRLIWVHFAILGAYLTFALLYLRVGAGDYALLAHKNVLLNLVDSAFWAFDLPHGWHTQWRTLPLWIYPAIFLFATAVVVGLLSRIRHSARDYRLSIFGIVWFLVALSPMLFLSRQHFLPYYLYLPLIGLSIVVGQVVEDAYTVVRHRKRRVAALVGLTALAFVGTGRTISVQADVASHPRLGASASLCETTISDMKLLRPSLPRGATLYIANRELPVVWWDHGLGVLFKLFYADDSLNVLYQSLGHGVSDDILNSAGFVAVEYVDGRLVDVTRLFVEDPLRFVTSITEGDFEYEESELMRLEVEPTEVVAGEDSYALRITGASDVRVDIQYRIDDGPLASFTANLNPRGGTRFVVSALTQKGLYRFVGFRLEGNSQWFRAQAEVRVR